MPFLAPFVIAALGVAAGSAAAIAITVALTVIEIVALTLISKLFAPSPNGSQLSNGATEEYSGTVEPRRIVYGTNLIGGLNAIPPWTHGTNNQMLDQVLVLAGHEVQAITNIFINQEVVLSSNIGAITGTQNDGKITTGTFANKIWVRRHTGAGSDSYDYILRTAWPGSWTVDHTGIGLAKIYIQYQFDTTVYSGGKPELRAVVQGKIIYDPRLDPTPGVNINDSRYRAYSCNPALCVVDYILDATLGIGEQPSRVDWVSAVAAANLCDELVAVPLLYTLINPYDPAHFYNVGDQVTVGTTVYACDVACFNVSPPNAAYWQLMAANTAIQRRYSCNTVLDCTAAYDDNLRTLAASFYGAVLYSSGKWVLLPGHWIAPTFTLGDDDVAGAITFNTATPYASRYNAVRGQFYDPANLYQPTEYPGIRVDSDEIDDGEGPVWRELQQPACVDIFEAQRNAIIEQRKSRRKKTWSFPCNYGAFSIRPGEFGQLSITELGISLQYVRCTGWQMDGKAMTMLINLEEVSPSDWYDPAVVVYQTATSLATPAPNNFISDPVQNLTAVGGNGGITFNWLLPNIWHSNLAVQLLESVDNNYANAVVIWSGVNTGVYIQKSDTTTRYYWTRVINYAGTTYSITNPFASNAGLAANASSAGVGPPGPPGTPGADAIVGSLTLEAIVLPADATGHVTSYANTAGQFVVYLGTTEITDSCTFSIAPNGNLTNLLYTLTGEVMTGPAVTGESQTVVGIGRALAPVTSAESTAQAQSIAGVGRGSRATSWDTTSLRWDSTQIRWDSSGTTGGGGGGGGGSPVTGTGGTGQRGTVQGSGTGSGAPSTSGLMIVTDHIPMMAAGFPSFAALVALNQAVDSTVVYTDTAGNPYYQVATDGRLIGFRPNAGSDVISCTANDGTGPVNVTFTVTTLDVPANAGVLDIDVSQVPTNSTLGNSCIFPLVGIGGRGPFAFGIVSQTVAGDMEVDNGYYGDAANPAWCCGVLTATTTTVFSIVDSNGATATRSVTITGDSVMRHKVPTMPQAMVGRRFRRKIVMTQITGVTVTGYSIGSGSLPPGMSLSAISGIISGAPTTAGSYTFVVATALSTGGPSNQTYTITVVPKRLGVRPSVNTGTGYYVNGPRVYTPDNFEFVMRGGNMTHFDSGAESSIILNQPNVQRVFTGPPYGNMTNWISACNNLMNGGVVPEWAFNCHADNTGNAAGSTAIADLAFMLDFMVSSRNVQVAKPSIRNGGVNGASQTFISYWNSYGFINLFNEWGMDATVVKNVVSGIAMSIASIVGNVITCNDTVNPWNSSLATLARVTVESVPGVSPAQYLTIVSTGGSAGAWTFTFSGATLNSTGAGGIMRSGCIGVMRGAGYTCPLTWDGIHYAQNINGDDPSTAGPTQTQSMLGIALPIMRSDPMRNTIAAPHVYGGWDTFTMGVQTLTKGSTTAITAKWGTEFHSNYGNADPMYGGYRAQLVGVQGIPSANNVVGGLTAQSHTSGSANFSYSFSINSSGAGTYVAQTGYLISVFDWRYLCQQLASLQSQGVCFFMEEVGGANPPMATASPGGHTNYMVIRAFEAVGFAGWALWSIDDGNGPANHNEFAFCDTQAGGAKGIYRADTGLTGQGKEIWNHPMVSYPAIAQPANDLSLLLP